jgi:hypothetical protein
MAKVFSIDLLDSVWCPDFEAKTFLQILSYLQSYSSLLWVSAVFCSKELKIIRMFHNIFCDSMIVEPIVHVIHGF